MAAEKMLHFCNALMIDYSFRDFATNEVTVVRHDARL